MYPFQYAADEQVDLIPYRLPSYPHDGPAVQRWLLDLYQPGQLVSTSELLTGLCTRIYASFRYTNREQAGVQLPCQTLAWGTGSCRDYAVLMMEAARHWGFGAVCHRLHPAGRGPARRHPRLDRSLPSRSRLAGLRSDKQQACRLRTHRRRGRPRSRVGHAALGLLGRTVRRLRADGRLGAGRRRVRTGPAVSVSGQTSRASDFQASAPQPFKRASRGSRPRPCSARTRRRRPSTRRQRPTWRGSVPILSAGRRSAPRWP